MGIVENMGNIMNFWANVLLFVPTIALAAGSDVVPSDCASKAEDLAHCSSSGASCLNQTVLLVQCLSGDAVGQANSDGVVLVVSAGSLSWRLKFPGRSRAVKGETEEGEATIYFRVGKCMTNTPVPDEVQSFPWALVVIPNKDDGKWDYRYHGFDKPNCAGLLAVATATEPQYFSSEVRSSIDTGATRPGWDLLEG